MKGKLISEGTQRTFAVILDTDDEAVACLTAFAKEHRLAASQFTALGAFRDCVLGYFDWQKKDYTRIPIDEQVEVLALVGDIALNDGEPKLHPHVVVGKADGTAHGGHLLEAHVPGSRRKALVSSGASGLGSAGAKDPGSRAWQAARQPDCATGRGAPQIARWRVQFRLSQSDRAAARGGLQNRGAQSALCAGHRYARSVRYLDAIVGWLNRRIAWTGRSLCRRQF
jgi:uncharacterized protein